MNKIYLLVVIFALTANLGLSKKSKKPIIYLTEDSTSFIKFSMTNQLWVRYTDLNEGSGLHGYSVNGGLFDVSLRRTRFVVSGKMSPKTYFLVQLGQNNFNMNSKKYPGIYFHDAIGEYHFCKSLHVGAGLTGWSGYLRYASPSVGSIMTLDAPLYQQATNGVNDQFLRKLSVYVKGQVKQLQYRVALTSPMSVQNATAPIGTLNLTQSSFALTPPKNQLQAYVNYQFFESESMLNPYTKGTYVGEKKVMSLGVGVIQQQDAMWLLNESGDTNYQAMTLFGADLFYEGKLDTNRKGGALTAYLAYSMTDFGKNYIRNVGVNNPVNTSSATSDLNGPGNAFPIIGTGHTVYGQLGYVMQCNNGGESKIQPYLASQISSFEYLDGTMVMIEGGANWFIRGKHSEKITLNVQNRPIFAVDAVSGNRSQVSRKMMGQIQFQLTF